MGVSWGKMRAILEQDNMCDSLKGRVQYFLTQYPKAHSSFGRFAVRLDGKEVFKTDYIAWNRKRDEAWDEINAVEGGKTEYWECADEMELGAVNKGGFTDGHVCCAFYVYHNSSIDECLQSQDPVVRLFAIFDKRVGKRRLRKIFQEIENQPEWLQVFYRLRCNAEGIYDDASNAKRAN